MKSRARWSPRAVRRASEAAVFIAKDNPAAAERWVRALFGAVQDLSRLPQRGRVVPEVGRPEIREIIFRGYRVVYRISPRWVEVLTIRHGKRQFSVSEVRQTK